ncbi:MAG: hypothetical protein ACREGJ_00060 [Candidatus Saccharimonadales bacterium]
MQRLIHHKEAGFVSLFSVIFFMLLITVITIGFLRIMAIEQRQALDNDLTASAIAAAESGIEDGKRAILKYYSLPNSDPLKGELASALNSSDCDALTRSPSIRTALGLNAAGNVIGNQELNQYYTCLSVNLNSPDYISHSPAGQSEYFPLKTSNPSGFEQIKISWHLISPSIGSDGDGVPSAYAPGPLLPPVINVNGNPTNSWSSQGYPAYLRVQLYGYPAGSFDRANLTDRNRSVFLVPSDSSNAAAVDENTPIVLSAADPRGFDQNKTVLRQVKCKPNPGANVGSYACTALVELPTDPTLRGNNNNYFLRVTPLYGQSHFRAVLIHDGQPVDMQEVQPIVDATGRAADVFRRIQARVRLNAPSGLPEFVAESANDICKNMEVADGTYYQPNNCP